MSSFLLVASFIWVAPFSLLNKQQKWRVWGARHDPQTLYYTCHLLPSVSQHASPYSMALARYPVEAPGHVGLLVSEAEPYSVDLTFSHEVWLKSHTDM